jgi:DNA-binding response OmpR family regulator
LNRNSEEVQRFSLPSPQPDRAGLEESGARPSIFLVEDNPADARLVREALVECNVGCELIVASDGERAIHWLDRIEAGQEACPSLLILDLNLPRRSGAEVLRRLREGVQTSGIPVLVLTSSDNQKDRDLANALGASRYLRKPTKLSEFIALGTVFQEMLKR